MGTCSLLAPVPTPELVALDTCGLSLLLFPQAHYLPHLRVLRSFNVSWYLFFYLHLCFDWEIFLEVSQWLEYGFPLLLL